MNGLDHLPRRQRRAVMAALVARADAAIDEAAARVRHDDDTARLRGLFGSRQPATSSEVREP